MSDKNDSLKILVYGRPELRQKSAPVEKISDNDRELISRMAELMYKNRGIGLAANQVGVLKQIAIVDIEQLKKESGSKQKRGLQVFINPEVIWESAEDVGQKEGCLSLPGIEAEIFRPRQIKISFYDLEFNRQELMAEDLLARVLLHEIDHLNGLLFIDHLSFAKRATLAGRLQQLKKCSLW